MVQSLLKEILIVWPPVTSDAAISKMTAFIISPPPCLFQCNPHPLSLTTFWFEPLIPVRRIIASHSGHNSLHFEQKTHSTHLLYIFTTFALLLR